MKKIREIKLKNPFESIEDERKSAYLYTFIISVGIYLFLFLLMGVTPFGKRSFCINDGMYEYMPFASDFVDNLRQGNIFYSFHGALGYNLFGTIMYYLSGPWVLLFVLFGKNNVTSTMQFIIAGKAISMGLSMTYFLLTREKRDLKLIVSLSILYEFSYYVIGYMYNSMWLDPIIMMPFIIVGLERLDEKKGRVQYVVALVIAMLCNYYMAAILCVFIAFYYIFIIADYRHIRHLISQTVVFAMCSLLAAVMSCIILLPVALDIWQMHASRLDSPEITFFHDILYAIEKHFPFSSIETVIFDDGELNVYCGVGVFFGALLFLVNKKTSWRKRIGYLMLSILLLVSFEYSPLNYLFHGFYQQCGIPNRYAFGYIFLMFTMAYEALTHVKSQNRLILLICSIAVIATAGYLLTTQQGIDRIESDVLDFFDLTSTQAGIFVFIYIALTIGVYSVGVFLRKQWCTTLIAATVMVEAGFNIMHVKAHTYLESYQYRKMYTEASSYVHAHDAKFYREAVLVDDSFENVNLYYNMNGVPTFNSIINTKTLDILGRLGFAKGDNYLRYDGHTPVTDMLLGVKYIYARNPVDFGDIYEEYDHDEHVFTYKNTYALPIGFALDTSHLTSNFTNKFNNISDLFEDYGQIYHNLPIKTTYDEGLNIVKEDNSNFRVDTEDGETATFTIKGINAENVYIYTRSWNVSENKVMVNDDVRSSINASGYITYLGDIADDDEVTVSFTYDEDEEDVETLIFVSSLDLEVLENIYYSLRMNAVDNVKQKGNTLTMDYTADEKQQLMFTLPYDPSWQVYVDDKKVKSVEILNGAFLGVDVSKGDHHIRITYVPRGLKEGALISMAGLTIFLFYLMIPEKKGGKRSWLSRRN